MDQIVKSDSPSHPARMREKARQLLQEIDVERLPSLPNILLSLLKVPLDTPKSLTQFANHVDKDPALQLRLLCMGQAHTVTQDNASTEDRLHQLNEHELKNLAITSAAQQYFSSNDRNPDHELNQNHFIKRHWQHAVSCAIAARAIAEQCHYPSPKEAYNAGLLHDVGQLALHCAYPDIVSSLSDQVGNDFILHDLEKAEFGSDHLYIGAELLSRYKANSFLCDAILYHHESAEKILDAHPLVKIIHLANQISNTDLNESDNDIFKHADQFFEFDRATVIKILAETNNAINEYAIEFEIDLDDDNDSENTTHIKARAEYIQAELDQQFQYINLLDGLHQQLSRTNNSQEIFHSIKQYINLLFDVEKSFIFLYDAENKILSICDSKNNNYLSEIKIPLQQNRSIISDCLLNKEIRHSFAHQYKELSIIDRQLISSTEKQGLICLPLVSHQENIGVLVLAINQAQQITLWKKLSLLEYFSREIAQTIHSRHSSLTKQNDYELRIREVIHEVRNPLSIINNYLEILNLKLGSEIQAQVEIQTIKTEINRIDDILQDLRNPEYGTGKILDTNINTLICELSQVFETSILKPKNIQLKLDLDTEISQLSCNANALKQIYTNLIKNAAEALPEKGQIMVYTQNQVNVDGITFIEITVEDNGPGIRSEVLNKLFKPVQTEKGDDHAGIGLSIVKKLITELNASISCRSSNKGTVFRILLPKK